MPRFGHRYRMRIGVLGGSFNPAHAGHRYVAEQAIRHCALDQLWLMVSPGNPLKPLTGMAPFPDRLASAARFADGRRIVATNIEAALGTRYTADTLAALRMRFPRVKFVWLMGADNFRQLPRWNHWAAIMRATPMLILPRPGSTRAALSGQAAARYAAHRVQARSALCLPGKPAPAWSLLPVRENSLSATALRRHLFFPFSPQET